MMKTRINQTLYVTMNWTRNSLLPWLQARPRRPLKLAAGLVALLVVIGLVTNGRSTAASGGSAADAGMATAEKAGQPTSKPTTQPTDGYYDPNAEGADPAWSVPAQLSAAEVKGLIKELDALQQETWRLAARVQAKYDELKVLDAEDVRQAVWQRAVGEGFKEPAVPLLYHEVMRDGSGILTGIATDMGHQADRQIFGFLNNRIAAAQVRLLGGRCLVGDKLFIKATANLISSKHTEYDALEARRNKLVAALGTEFPRFDEFRQSVLKNEQSSFIRLPHSEGYQRLPGATKNQ